MQTESAEEVYRTRLAAPQPQETRLQLRGGARNISHS